jgi:hypothetical protein
LEEIDETKRRRGRGRPKKDSSKADRFELRLSPEEKDMLDDMVDNSDKTRSDHLRRALLFYYNAGYWRK